MKTHYIYKLTIDDDDDGQRVQRVVSTSVESAIAMITNGTVIAAEREGEVTVRVMST